MRTTITLLFVMFLTHSTFGGFGARCVAKVTGTYYVGHTSGTNPVLNSTTCSFVLEVPVSHSTLEGSILEGLRGNAFATGKFDEGIGVTKIVLDVRGSASLGDNTVYKFKVTSSKEFVQTP